MTMMNGQGNTLLRHLRCLAISAAEVTDGELLNRFIRERDESAFEVLMRRHGPLVLCVARRMLSNSEDVEDVFQATFLTLVRRAASIRKRSSVAAWLHGVTYHLALKVRADAAKRRARQQSQPAPPRDLMAELTARELCEVLDTELNSLPEKYREAWILCHLEGKTRDEAAKALGLSVATLKRRLEEGRALLGERLGRRGIGLAAVLSGVALAEATASAARPTGLVIPTMKAAISAGAGGEAASVSAKVVALAEGMVNAMFISKVKLAMIVLMVCMIGFGATLFTYHTLAADKSSPAPTKQNESQANQQNQPPQTAPQPKSDKEKFQGTWIVASAKAGGGPAPDHVKSLKLVFAGDKVAFHYTEEGNALVKDGTYKLDSTKKPKEIDFISEGRTQEAIYNFEDDQLSLALTEIGQARPREFVPSRDSRQMLIVFKRERTGAETKTKQAVRDPLDSTENPVSVQPKKLLQESFQATAKMTYPTDRMVLLLGIARLRARLSDEPGVAKAIEEALQIAGSLREEDRPPISKSQSLTSIAMTQAEVGDFAGARKTIEHITALKGETHVALAALAEHQARTGDIKGALRTTSDIQGDAQKGHALKGIATHQVEASDIEGALATTQTIKDDFQRIEALVAIARVQFRKGEAAAAKERLQQARQIADKAKSGPTGQERTFALLDIAEALAEMDDKQGALKITRQIQDSKVLPEPTDAQQSTGHWRLARAQWKAGDFKAARRTAELIEDQQMQGRTWYEIARAEVNAGDIAAGIKTIEMVSGDWQKSHFQSELAKALSRKGDRKGASTAFQQALSFVEKDSEPPHSRLTKLLHLRWLVKEQGLVGHEKEAMTWIERQTSIEFRAAALLGLAEGLLDRNKETKK